MEKAVTQMTGKPSEDIYDKVIGLEVHVELATKTKIFCGCSTAFGAVPNVHTCPVCMGMPGSLPVLNRQVVEYAIAVGLAANCHIASVSRFDRKNYFYPDNPQNYQISQLYAPICTDGYVEILVPESRRIGIREIHMEEDAGKLFHAEGQQSTYVDYNRAGVPLIEIVTEPDMTSAEEVIAFLEKLKMLIQYLGVSDCKLNEGSMRVDVNLSVKKKGSSRLGTRTEMKNLNSFRAVRRAIEGEYERQINLLRAGRKVEMETRRWDDINGMSYSMRSKEDARDYRYFPEPDLLPVIVEKAWITEIKSRQPEWKEEKMARFVKEHGIPAYDADIITSSKIMADLYEATVREGATPKQVCNYLMGETLRLLRERKMEPEELQFSPRNLAKLIRLTEEGVVNSTVAKEVFLKIFEEDVEPETYIDQNDLRQTTDEEGLKEQINRVIEENPKSVADYQGGKEKALGFLVGQTMKATKGKADPGMIKRLLILLLQKG